MTTAAAEGGGDGVGVGGGGTVVFCGRAGVAFGDAVGRGVGEGDGVGAGVGASTAAGMGSSRGSSSTEAGVLSPPSEVQPAARRATRISARRGVGMGEPPGQRTFRALLDLFLQQPFHGVAGGGA